MGIAGSYRPESDFFQNNTGRCIIDNEPHESSSRMDEGICDRKDICKTMAWTEKGITNNEAGFKSHPEKRKTVDERCRLKGAL